MDLTYPPEAEEFRTVIRAWLEENLPEGWGEPGFHLEGDDRARFNRLWTEKLYEGGWICASWPKEYGGKGLSTMEAVVQWTGAGELQDDMTMVVARRL